MSVVTPSAHRTVSRAEHDAAVAELVHSFRGVPASTRVRLGKPSSNLFRFGGPPAHLLDASRLTGVLAVDPVAGTAEVQGTTTYEDLVAATLPYGFMPTVVPQLKTITLGGAVTGLGIESTSFRYGLPHESVQEMDILTPTGEIVTAREDNEHAELFATFPNSYGSLGYTLRIVVELLPVKPFVELTHLPVASADLAATITDVCGPAAPDFVDGTVFGRGRNYLTLGTFSDDPGPAGPSDYTGQKIFYRSVGERSRDVLTVHDYIWRWDTDWFWCSRALGVQHPLGRRLWPSRYRRSDVYRKIVGFEKRHQLTDRVARVFGRPESEAVIQDVEIPVERLAEFLEAFHSDVGITPVWLCPIRLRGERSWPLYPMTPGELYVNVGFWATVPQRPDRPDWHNRRVEELVAEFGGHKSLYSTVHYSRDEFWHRYNGAAYDAVKKRYDPHGRMPDLYAKVTGSGRA